MGRARIWQKTTLIDPNMTPGGKVKISNLYCIFSRHAQLYPRVSIVIPENVDVVQETILLKKENIVFRPSFNRDKMYWPLIDHRSKN